MKTIMQSIRMLLVLTIVTGLIYPVLITGLSQLSFPQKANGSILFHGESRIGSELIGQTFTSDSYFWSRPSAIGYSPLPSSGTNLGPTSSVLRDSVVVRAARLGVSAESTPADLLFASGSGLDPHISPAAAAFQIDRVLAARGWTDSKRAKLSSLVSSHTEGRQFGLFGEPRVNVLLLNLALDSLQSHQ